MVLVLEIGQEAAADVPLTADYHMYPFKTHHQDNSVLRTKYAGLLGSLKVKERPLLKATMPTSPIDNVSWQLVLRRQVQERRWLGPDP